jgi:hypothetical protein
LRHRLLTHRLFDQTATVMAATGTIHLGLSRAGVWIE